MIYKHIQKTMKNNEKLRFDLFCHVYTGFDAYIEKLREPLTPVQEKERELVSTFTSGFQKIVSRLTSQNTREILDELCELRDDCHEKYEELTKSCNLSLNTRDFFRKNIKNELIKPCRGKIPILSILLANAHCIHVCSIHSCNL